MVSSGNGMDDPLLPFVVPPSPPRTQTKISLDPPHPLHHCLSQVRIRHLRLSRYRWRGPGLLLVAVTRRSRMPSTTCSRRHRHLHYSKRQSKMILMDFLPRKSFSPPLPACRVTGPTSGAAPAPPLAAPVARAHRPGTFTAALTLSA